ncbi:hypothetical protein [Nocardia sp. NPDC060249]|uniref:hypothetical protein n=1 Tax=Nocardia sp. NPDC060249 TaxID=3347082 RepID=UPI003664D92C
MDFETNRATGDHDDFEPNPLTAEQVAQVRAAIARTVQLPAYPVYVVMVDFLAYTGLRASEKSGLEVQDLEFRTGPAAIRCLVHVRCTKGRKQTPHGR